MGGCCCCCCSARASDSDRAPHRQNPEEHAPLSSAFDGPSPTSAIVAVDTNLDTPSLDTYRAPPAPLPYDVCFTVSENPDVEKSGIKIKTDGQQSPKVDEFESCEKGAPEDKADEEEDVCPICLEDNSDRWDVRIAFLAAVPVELAFFVFVFVVVWSGRLSGGGDG
ncbi:putative RING zinc finger domain superfamily protein isoform X9 [Zea mays]|uniref:Putative E3 ubiquitin-protein ligase RHB1A n=1 Tax=Zea mays TaxID=4577 RepID=A0A1D6HPU8_MAIZE|nr:putative RING zinc finger domain superfamily protein isoform X9 [Zea mays]AQK76296.1 putative E3 ubiquitin-protein ligase RHB1A [Zea mays]